MCNGHLIPLLLYYSMEFKLCLLMWKNHTPEFSLSSYTLLGYICKTFWYFWLFGQMVLSWTKLWNFDIDHLSTEIHIYRRLRRLCFYTCLSVNGGGGYPGQHPGGGLGVWLGGIPACTEADPPAHQQTATAAGGTNPTGMHSCGFCVNL